MDNDQMANADTSTMAGKGRAPRRMILGGVVALVVIAGVLVVGTQVTGSRSGTVSSFTCKKNLGQSDKIDSYATQYGPAPTGVRFVVYKFYSSAGIENASKSGYYNSTTNPLAKVATAPSSAYVVATLWSPGTTATQVGTASQVDCT